MNSLLRKSERRLKEEFPEAVMNQTNPIEVLQNLSPITLAPLLYGLFLKSLFLIAFGLYVAFAFLMIRQVRLMGQTVKTTLEPVLLMIAFIHFLVAIGVFLAAFLLL